MTHQPDDRHPEDPATGSSEGEPALTDDAVWESIIAHYGDRPDMFDAPETEPGPGTAVEPRVPVVEPVGTDPPRRSVFDRSFVDSQPVEDPGELNSAASWDDEGHFVPPPPPPLPVLEPRRRLAWAGMFGAPFLMLLAVVFGWTYPAWFMAMLVASFVGGFIYLVATMSRVRGDWPDDNGAVV